MIKLLNAVMEFSGSLNNQIPVWGVLCAFLAGTYFIINMNFKITLLEKEIQEQKKTLAEIKSLFYEFIKPK